MHAGASTVAPGAAALTSDCKVCVHEATGCAVAVGVACTGVAVGGTDVAVGGTDVAVGGTDVAVGGTGVAVGGTGVAVGGTGAAGIAGALVGCTVGADDASTESAWIIGWPKTGVKPTFTEPSGALTVTALVNARSRPPLAAYTSRLPSDMPLTVIANTR